MVDVGSTIITVPAEDDIVSSTVSELAFSTVIPPPATVPAAEPEDHATVAPASSAPPHAADDSTLADSSPIASAPFCSATKHKRTSVARTQTAATQRPRKAR
ncbi:Protein of unknown function [Pyronema omphalodes CBS 100304]|uniref:Uncharacterized protein n=1 Tax=Pyronema omphalodes (strain CBS 100304) TaxID=1076935 RepID=U4LML2_PYROM|nr:Protein of unknown function [Pyronema omphalodes CBS 100304]